MIDIQGLSKVFKVHKKAPGLSGSMKALFSREWHEKRAVNQVSLKVEAGEIVGLIGANGAGKTTLVKMCSGIIQPTSGHLKILGYDPFKRENDFRRQIALIMGQKAQLWWDLPAADCFLLLKEIYQIGDKDYHETLDFLCQTLDIKKELHTQIRRLSLGERMKMELIAALLHKPRVVFLDEPTIGLDLMAQKAIREFILNYRRIHKPAMILTSHYMEDIESLCERIVIIKEGEIIYDGALKKVLSEYATHKTITMILGKGEKPSVSEGADLSGVIPGLKSGLGKVIQYDGTILKIHSERSAIAEVASAILGRFPVMDMTIEEEDIAAIIEQIMVKGSISGAMS